MSLSLYFLCTFISYSCDSPSTKPSNIITSNLHRCAWPERTDVTRRQLGKILTVATFDWMVILHWKVGHRSTVAFEGDWTWNNLLPQVTMKISWKLVEMPTKYSIYSVVICCHMACQPFSNLFFVTYGVTLYEIGGNHQIELTYAASTTAETLRSSDDPDLTHQHLAVILGISGDSWGCLIACGDHKKPQSTAFEETFHSKSLVQ